LENLSDMMYQLPQGLPAPHGIFDSERNNSTSNTNK
jgi:hypothetical protein